MPTLSSASVSPVTSLLCVILYSAHSAGESAVIVVTSPNITFPLSPVTWSWWLMYFAISSAFDSNVPHESPPYAWN